MRELRGLAVAWYSYCVSEQAVRKTLKFGTTKLLTGAAVAVIVFIVQQNVFHLPTAIRVLASVGIGYFALLVGSLAWYMIRTPADLDSEKAGRISELNNEVASFQFTPVQRERRQPLLERLTAVQTRIGSFEREIPRLIVEERELATLGGGREFETRSTQIIENRTAVYNDFEQIVREINLCFEIGAGFSMEIARLRGEFSTVRTEVTIGTPPRTVLDRCQVVRTYVDAFLDRLVVNREHITADHR